MLILGAGMGLMGHWVFDAIYLLGGIGYGLYFLLASRRNQSVREQRLSRMNVFASLLFIISAVARLGYLDAYGQGLWILFFALGLIFMLYANVVGLYIKDNKDAKYNNKKYAKKSK